MHTLSWLLLVIVTIFLPSAVVHCKLIVAIIRERRKNANYRALCYRLFVLQGSLEITLIIIHLLGRLLIRERLAGNAFILSLVGTCWPSVYYYGTIYYFMNAQVEYLNSSKFEPIRWSGGVIVQSLGRFLTVCAPRSRMTRILESVPDYAWLLTNMLVPLMMISRQLFQDPMSFEIVPPDGYAIIQIPPHVGQVNNTQGAIGTTVAAVLCALSNALMLRKLVLSKKQKLTSTGKQHRLIVQLALVGCMHLLAQCFMTACHLTIAINVVNNKLFAHLFRHLYVIPAMLVTFVNPWMLVIMDHNMRNRNINLPCYISNLKISHSKRAVRMLLFCVLFIFSIIFFPSAFVYGKLIVHTIKQRGIAHCGISSYGASQFRMNLFWLLFIFSIIFFPSPLVHCKLIVYTIKQRGCNVLYRSLFYRLFVIQGVLEITLLVVYIVGRLLIRENLAGNDFIMSLNGDVFPKLYHYGTIYFYFHVQVWGVIVQSLGRFAIVCAPNSIITLWLESLPDVAWVLTNTLAPLTILSPQLFGAPILFRNNNTDGDVDVHVPRSVYRSDTLQCAISTCIASIVCAACNALVLRKMMESKKQLYSKGKQHRQVVQLTLVGFVNLLAQCAMTACHLIVVLNVQIKRFAYLFRHLYVIPAMLLTFVNPWMLVITDKNMRKCLMKC